MEIQILLCERFRGVSGFVPDFAPEMQSRTRGTAKTPQKRDTFLAIFFACWRDHLGPSGPTSQKSPKMGSRVREAPAVKKVEKESKKSPQSQKVVNFGLFFDTFSTPGAESPREPIFGCFWDFGPEGPK